MLFSSYLVFKLNILFVFTTFVCRFVSDLKTYTMETAPTGISEQVLNWINESTHRLDLEEKTTKQIAAHFNLTTNAAYRLCSILAQKGLIIKLDPVNGDKFDCCGWIRNEDPE